MPFLAIRRLTGASPWDTIRAGPFSSRTKLPKRFTQAVDPSLRTYDCQIRRPLDCGTRANCVAVNARRPRLHRAGEYLKRRRVLLSAKTLSWSVQRSTRSLH